MSKINCAAPRLRPVPPEEEIVISGISGRFPESDDMKHFQENLMNKVDLITGDDRRWKLSHPEIPQNLGKVNKIDKFDAEFFGIDYKQAHTMDPYCRMHLEHAYEAIVDAGVNPRRLRGTKCGVYVGTCASESENTWFYEKLHVKGFGIPGCSRAMIANNVSRWLGVTGPSYSMDTACSSSLFAMEQAYRDIRSGVCDSALVSGINLCLNPLTSLQFYRLGVLSHDGRCKTFDELANGYARSEAVSVIFLQKAKDAKRVYATYIYGKTNCDGYKEQGITFPSSQMQYTLLKDFYEDIGIPPSSLAYIEAHGTGTKVGDPEETSAIDRLFCVGRKEPLWIGSVKSNLGHSEPASGMCSIAKVIIAMESGFIPPNLNFKINRKDIKALQEGRLKVVTEPTPWPGGLVGINSFGFGGANAHVLLKSNSKEKINGSQPNDDLPRLVGVSGRTAEAVTVFLNDIESRPADVEYIKLLHDIHSEPIIGHPYRGYTILPPRGLVKNKIREIASYTESKRPVCFVFPGLGSQWPGMGTALLKLKVFADTIKRCNVVLKPYGIDIVDIITNKDPKIFDNILNSLVGVAAIQIGLVEVLQLVDITPDNIIGHSVGELGCAYADGCFTAEQMILSAYSYGLALTETNIVYGSMAIVRIGNAKLKDICPADIDIACHDSADSVIISGPADSVKIFVAKLQANNIFAEEVPCNNIPFHSRYVASTQPKLLSSLQKIIPSAKPRSSKWLSTSVPRNKWSTAAARLSSADYHTNNFLSPVLFEETSALIPKNAITIEIAPQSILQAILQRSLAPTISNIALFKCSREDNVEVLLQSLGKLFNAGLQPQLDKLYPPVEFPVSRTTPMISPLIKWDHSKTWYVTSCRLKEKISSGERVVDVLLVDEDFEFISGHVIDGRTLFPATGYLFLIWETISMMRGESYTEVITVFEDVKFLRATTVPSEGSVQLNLMVQKGSGRFEVTEGGVAVVTGNVRTVTNSKVERVDPNTTIVDKNEPEDMSSRDFYKELRLRGYQYRGLFRSVVSSTITGSKGHITWSNNWVAFMDNMLQMQILGTDTRGLFVPTGIKKMVIDPINHLDEMLKMPDDKKEFSVYVNKTLELIVSGGVEIRGLRASAIPRRKPAGEPVLEDYKFVANADRAEVSFRDMVRLSTHIALENNLGIKVKTIELLDRPDWVSQSNLISPLVAEALGDMPLIQADVSIAGTNAFINDERDLPADFTFTDIKKIPNDTNALLTVGHKLLTPDRAENLKMLLEVTKKDGFLLSREDCEIKNVVEIAQSKGLEVILEKKSAMELFVLLRKRVKLAKKTIVIYISNDEFDWVEEMRRTMTEVLEKHAVGSVRIVFVSEGDAESGLIGFINCLRREPGGEIVHGILIQDPKAPKFSLQEPFYAKELQKNLAVYVLRENGIWGSYRHLPLAPLGLKPVHHVVGNQAIRGDLASLTWFEGPILPDYKTDDLINVFYSSINFKDIMLATGKLAAEVVVKNRLTQECILGFEYSGVTAKGKRLMGLIDSQALTNIGTIHPFLTWEIPTNWSLEDAATVPCVYGTCFYALYTKAKIKKGDKILIHAGTGGIGQAAINIALYEGCEIFTTVGTPEKRRFIREHFPQIKDDHIGNSRDTSFEQLIMFQTNGRGVDIVLNSLAEEKLQASVRCLAPGGHFCEIGKFDLAANNPLRMECFTKAISFHGVMLDNVISADTDLKVKLKKIFGEGLTNGAIKPLTRTVFQKDQLEAAFRYMAAGKHMGKVIIKVRDEEEPLNQLIMAVPRYYCHNNRSYIILGGLGGFGLELADWLVLRGAKYLVITSRVGIRNGYQKMRVKLWESYGTKVVIISGKDASKREDCQSIVETAVKLAPVDGIFNLAVVLKDALWDNQTPETFKESFKSKAWSTKQLDEITRKLCPNLRHFVVFSSVSCGRGNAGQTNYGMSNSVMERICERRVAEGLPGLAIQWGAVGDVGLVADMQEENKELVIGGTLQQKILSCLQELDGFLRQDSPIVSSMVVAEKKAGSGGATNIVDAVLNIMGLKDLKTVSPQTSLSELGMDSMMAVEIKQTLEREFELFLTAQDIRSLNFSKLQEISGKNAESSKQRDVDEDDSGLTVTGINLLVRTLGLEEFNFETCLQLSTKNDASLGEVFLVPGIEGIGTIFGTLAPKLKAPAICLQFDTEEASHESVFTMAEKLLPHILKRNRSRRNFLLVGYSFGSMVAIELARRLEKEGLRGKLILVDGSPNLMKSIVSQQLASNSQKELQNNVLLGIMDLISPKSSPKLLTELEKYTTWEEKLKTFLQIFPDKKAFGTTDETQAAFCTAIYKRLLAILNYDVSQLQLIKTPILLLKPSSPTFKNAPEDYDLSKITSEKVEIHYVNGNHVNILDDDNVAIAINGECTE